MSESLREMTYDEQIADFIIHILAIETPFSVKRDLMRQAADAIEELQQSVRGYEQLCDAWETVAKELQGRIKDSSRWIPVTERLPQQYKQCDVLCYYEGVVVVGYYTDEEVGWHDLHSYKIYPTHWMPLPEPPRKEES